MRQVIPPPPDTARPADALQIPASNIEARQGRHQLLRRPLIAADLTAVTSAFLASGYMHSGAITRAHNGEWTLVGLGALSVQILCLVALLVAFRMYSADTFRAMHSSTDELGKIFQCVSALALIELTIETFNIDLYFQPSIQRICLFWILATILMISFRGIARKWAKHRPGYRQRTAIIGSGALATSLGANIALHPKYGLDVVGYLQCANEQPTVLAPDIPMIGTLNDIPRALSSHRIDRVIVMSRERQEFDLETTVRQLHDLDVLIDVVPMVPEIFSHATKVHHIHGVPLLAAAAPDISRIELITQRVFDLVLASLLIVIAAPIFLLVAPRIYRHDRGSVFFRQERIGKDGRPFLMYKFRTMHRDADRMRAYLRAEHGSPDGLMKLPEDPRITPPGRGLRRHSIDELPQLFNVLRGEMSLVGPRPLVPNEAAQITGWGINRTRVRPGMTGLWQIHGRNDLSIDDMVALDFRYVSNFSILEDVRCLLKTIPVVVHGDHIVR